MGEDPQGYEDAWIEIPRSAEDIRLPAGSERRIDAVTQRLLEHSSPQLTNDVYTNVDPALRQAIDLLQWRTGYEAWPVHLRWSRMN